MTDRWRQNSPAANRRLVERWNARHPVGTVVLYWPVIDRPEMVFSRTRELARMLGDNAVVPIEARAGVVSLWHVKPTPVGYVPPKERV